MNVKALIFALSLTATMSASAQGTAGIDRANMNLSVKPGNDFYEYAIGGWRKAHPLDAEHARNGSFTDLDEMNQKRILALIQEYSSKPQAQGTLGQKIGSLYNLAMDSVRRNREGAAPIQPVLKKIADIQNRRDYQLVTSQLDARGISCMMFGMGVGADQKDAANNLVGIGQGGLGLGERDYYLSDDAQVKGVRDAYVKFLTASHSLATTLLQHRRRQRQQCVSRHASPRQATLRCSSVTYRPTIIKSHTTSL